VRFIKATTGHLSHVTIYGGRYCQSGLVGMGATQQTMRLGGRCTVGDVIHELLHVLGFWHEHQRPDRDAHVRVDERAVFKYVGALELINFVALPGASTSFPYDPESVMHYAPSERSPSKDIVFIESLVATSTPSPMGQRQGLSEGDVVRLRTRYGVRPGHSVAG
jgi:hypothetical protein